LNLVCNVGAGITDVAIHLAEHADVLVTVEEGVLVLAVHARATGTTMGGLVRLKAGVGQHDNEALRVFVGRGDGGLLLGNQLRERGRRK
jgi:hypothetical protein